MIKGEQNSFYDENNCTKEENDFEQLKNGQINQQIAKNGNSLNNNNLNTLNLNSLKTEFNKQEQSADHQLNKQIETNLGKFL